MVRTMICVLLLISHAAAESRVFCEKSKIPLDVGEWRNDLEHFDSAVVENKPVTMNEGQVYVYENSFPSGIIKYINIDNFAVMTCGAEAMIKKGGIGTSYVLIVLHADSNQEMRSVIDIWGIKQKERKKPKTVQEIDAKKLKSIKSLYLFKDIRAVNHNRYDSHFLAVR